MYPAYPRHFFSLRGLVHICIPQTGTPCGRVMGLKVLPTLVGLSLWDCLALAFCTLIVSHFKGFVKRFFKFFLKNLFDWLYRTPTNALGCVAYYPRLLTPLLYHNLGDLSRGFLHFFSRVPTSSPLLRFWWLLGCLTSPLDNDSIPQTALNVNR